MANPIQIVLNPDNFLAARENPVGGGNKDFFAGRDREFDAHRAELIRQLNSAAQQLERQPEGDMGYLKVVLRREAWAKSHRPFDTLFRSDHFPLVGGEDFGVMLVEAYPGSLRALAAKLPRAESETRYRPHPVHGRPVPNPSRIRSEIGAIDHIRLFDDADRRDFSVEDAVAWLSDPVSGSAYEVELFEVPPPVGTWDAYDAPRRRLYQSFIDGLSRTQPGLVVRRLQLRSRGDPLLSFRLEATEAPPLLMLSAVPSERGGGDLRPFDQNPARHQRLLTFLDHHPLVRAIRLPARVVPAHRPPGDLSVQDRARPENFELPDRDTQRSYPRLGIIDGGISDAIEEWIIDRWDLLSDEDKNESHGTFIGGLAVAGQQLNGSHCCPESDGAELIDMAVFPAGPFSDYYPEGVPQFFDEIENAVAEARTRHGVRIFNMSLNITQPVATSAYSAHAARLDQLADTHDALFFLSAGNIESADMRPEWPADAATALANLARARNDGIRIPSESVRSVAVAALNPPGDPTRPPFAPARYSRRGPGLRSGNKPDLAHVGGFGSVAGSLGHGLFSITPEGLVTDGCGTSYATPIVARTAAALEHAIEGNVSRETLIALLVHKASIPQQISDPILAGVARHLVGFGVPAGAAQILETDDHEITLVFAARIRPSQQINFNFQWPQSLVDVDGRCRGRAKLTLVASPPLDARFGAEFVRINVEAALRQQKPDGRWTGRLDPLYLPGRGDEGAAESELIEHGFKWSPVKVYAKTFRRGVGATSNWRLSVNYLTRAGETMPAEGVPFTALLTLSDPEQTAMVFNELRQTLAATGVQVADIRTAARVTARV